MRRPPPIVARHGASVRPTADEILGEGHALARAIHAVERTAKQWLTVAGVLAGSIIALGEGGTWAAPLVISAGIVLSGLTGLIALLENRKRERAIDLILGGSESLPLAAVQRQRRRLERPRLRCTLARTFEAMIQEACTPRATARYAPPMFDAAVIVEVAADLRAVICLLHDERAPIRGVAFAERLILDGGSTLYLHDASALREELYRAERLLSDSRSS